MLELVAYTLRQAGYRVLTAIDGSEALNRARSGLPDLIVMDLMLPGLDGMAVCELLHRLPSTAAIPLVVLTAQIGEDLPARVALAGAVDCLRKPFAAGDLLLRLHNALARAEAQRRLKLGETLAEVGAPFEPAATDWEQGLTGAYGSAGQGAGDASPLTVWHAADSARAAE